MKKRSKENNNKLANSFYDGNQGVPYKITFNDKELKGIYYHKKVSYNDLSEEGTALIDTRDFSLILIKDGVNIVVFRKTLVDPVWYQVGLEIPKTWILGYHAFYITSGTLLEGCNEFYTNRDSYNISSDYLTNNYRNLVMLSSLNYNMKTLFCGINFWRTFKQDNNKKTINIWFDRKRKDYDMWINNSTYKFLLLYNILMNASIPTEIYKYIICIGNIMCLWP